MVVYSTGERKTARVEAEERRVFEQRRETPEETAARHARE
jgi:hypothetical protein